MRDPAGSLYHHFESKEALIVELVERYQADLDAVAESAVQELRRPDPGPSPTGSWPWVKPSPSAPSATGPHCC